MSCGERVPGHKTTTWGWCRKWGVPYPCRKVVEAVGYRYTFSALREVPSFNKFVRKREGCCEGRAYAWQQTVLWNTPKPYGWVTRNPPVEMIFDEPLDDKGACAERA